MADRPSRASRASEAIRRRSTELKEDVKESTDANLLGILRFFGLLYGPIDRRARIDEALRKALRYRIAGHVGWKHALGGITYLLLIVLVVTGVLLSFYYRPSVQEAYPSVQHIVSRVPFGWLVRDVHVWSASLIVVVAAAHMARVFFGAAYKPPRETNWLIGLLLLLVVLAFGATGYLLPWDQWAYWTVTRGFDVVAAVPLLGPLTTELLRGDVIVSGATLSRSFALHVILLPWLLFGLVILHFTLVRTHGVAPPVGGQHHAGGSIPFYPNHLLRSLMVAVLVVAVLISLAALFPRPLSEAADPGQLPSDVVSRWVIVDVLHGIVHFLGGWGLALFGLLGLALVLLPLFDRDPEQRVHGRPLVAALGYAFFIGLVLAWGVGRTLPAAEVSPPAELMDATEPAGPPLEPPGPTPVRPAPPTQPPEGG